MESIPIGSRISVSGCPGTVKFAGPVEQSKGLWIGIEWDDPARGKHDGSKDGKQYFTCRFPTSGSFIRATSSITIGTSFLEALTAKYVEQVHGADSLEKITLGSSNGAIEVEAVGLDKIRGKFANLHNLREVSLDNEYVSRGDVFETIQSTCPNIRGLNLSGNLLPSWETVASIAAPLTALERLALNLNRLLLPRHGIEMKSAFCSLTDLQLNDTLISWQEMQAVTALMPKLELVELGYNHIGDFSCADSDHRPVSYPSLRVINLDTNDIRDWLSICRALRPYPSLQRLVLTSNHMDSISLPLYHQNAEEKVPTLDSLSHLSLSSNLLGSWSDIDAISRWCPSLQSLSLSGNPLTEDHLLARFSRQFVVAKIPTLTSLDAAHISQKERVDCELFYLSHITQNETVAEEDRSRQHPRWKDLCLREFPTLIISFFGAFPLSLHYASIAFAAELIPLCPPQPNGTEHGKPDEVAPRKQHLDKLGNRIIQVQLYLLHGQPSRDVTSKDITSSPAASLRCLPSMQLRNLRLKVLKSHTPSLPKNTPIELWLEMDEGKLGLLALAQDGQDLAWWGFENGSRLFYYVDADS